MDQRELVCIGCPMGCLMQVEIESGKVVKVSGNTCSIGKTYAEKECTNPTRIVTSTVRVLNGAAALVPVKTASDIPKAAIFKCMEELKAVRVKAPVSIGDVVLKNAAGTGIDIIATKNILIKQ